MQYHGQGFSTVGVGVRITAHWQDADHRRRQSLIDRLGGDGNPIAVCYMDKGHRNGAEFHTLTDNGIIIVENAFSGRLITKKLARVGQIRQLERCYDQLNHRQFSMRDVPHRVIMRCCFYKEHGYNNM